MESADAPTFWFEDEARLNPAPDSKRAGGPAGYGWEARRPGRHAEIAATPSRQAKGWRRRAQTIRGRSQPL